MPTKDQFDSLMYLLALLLSRYSLKVDAVRGHTEMGPLATSFASKLQTGDPLTGAGDHSCPGTNLPMAEVRDCLQKIINRSKGMQV